MTARQPGEEWKSVTIPYAKLVVCNNDHAYNAQDNPVCPSCSSPWRWSVEKLVDGVARAVSTKQEGGG